MSLPSELHQQLLAAENRLYEVDKVIREGRANGMSSFLLLAYTQVSLNYQEDVLALKKTLTKQEKEETSN